MAKSDKGSQIIFEEAQINKQQSDRREQKEFAIYTAIGEMMGLARDVANITQDEMAKDILFVSKNYISLIERGKTRITMSHMLTYCDRCNCDPNDILFPVLDVHLQLNILNQKFKDFIETNEMNIDILTTYKVKTWEEYPEMSAAEMSAKLIRYYLEYISTDPYIIEKVYKKGLLKFYVPSGMPNTKRAGRKKSFIEIPSLSPEPMNFWQNNFDKDDKQHSESYNDDKVKYAMGYIFQDPEIEISVEPPTSGDIPEHISTYLKKSQNIEEAPLSEVHSPIELYNRISKIADAEERKLWLKLLLKNS